MGILLSLLLFVAPVNPQPSQPSLSDDARATLLTIMPGDAIHARWGHTALRIHDPATRTDIVFNYGTFDFSDPWFVPRFVYGDLEYYLSIFDFYRGIEHYRDVEGRPVIAQGLDLTPDEVRRLYQLLQENLRPENRSYQYDFFFDNCSTRPRDVIELVLGERLRYDFGEREPRSFRELIHPYIGDQTFLRTGIDLLLGMPADRPATHYEQTFLPMDLFNAFERATVQRDDGYRPLVAYTDTVAWVEGYELEGYAPGGYERGRQAGFPWAAVFSAFVLLIGVLYSRRELFGDGKTPVVFDRLLFAAAGLAGVVVLFMWTISLHGVTSPNLNLFWLWPTHLAAAFFMGKEKTGGRTRRERHHQGYLLATALVTGIFAALWPMWPQHLPTEALPLAGLLALRSGVMWYGGRTGVE